MKTLYLARHAEAEAEADLGDFYRSLTLSGYRQAAVMGEFLVEKQIVLDALITSEAVRAYTTTKQFADALHIETSQIQAIKELYNASVRTLMHYINELPETSQNVMIVGHNPYISYLAEFLCPQNIGSFETCTVVCISFDNQEWSELNSKTGILEWIKNI